MRTKLVALSAAVAALVAGPLGAAPAHAQCENIKDPFDYPCDVAIDTVRFAEEQANDLLLFVDDVHYIVGETVVRVVCTAFPENCD